MYDAYLWSLVFITVGSLAFSILAFMGKEIILDDTYLKASKEARETMDKKAYCVQAGIIFGFLFVVSLCNVLRFILHIKWLTYVSLLFVVVGVIYTIASHHKLKK